MSPIWWYLAGVVTLPALFVLWLALGFITGSGTFTLRTTVNGRVVREYRRGTS